MATEETSLGLQRDYANINRTNTGKRTVHGREKWGAAGAAAPQNNN